MKSAISIIAVSLALALSSPVWAESGGEGMPEGGYPDCNDNPAIMPEANLLYQEQILEELTLQIDTENFSFLKSRVEEAQYLENGLLESVTYRDGTFAEYSYVEDNGEVVTCQIETADILLIFAGVYEDSDGNFKIKTPNGEQSLPHLAQNANSFNSEDTVVLLIKTKEPDGETTFLSLGGRDDPDDNAKESDGETIDPPAGESDDPDDNNKPRDPIIIVLPGPRGREILDDTSREPIDYDFIKRIKDSMDSASKDRQVAYNEYMKNTEPYYKKTYAVLKEKAGDLKSENIELAEYFKGLASAETAETGKRELIDDAVAYIAREAEIAGDEKIVAMEFLTVEKTYREQFLKIGKEVYDRKIEKILKYIDALINELLGSRLGLYFNKTKDKIDIIINIPKLTEKE